MKLSHSKLSTILTCPMTYYLQYKVGITAKEKKKALSVGSAVHWGLEHNTFNLDEYFIENDEYVKNTDYTRDQCLAQAMTYGYLKLKDKIYDELLTDANGSKATIIEESHELFLEAALKSFKFDEPHKFIGIIDLLLLTDKGWLIVDYKTSSQVPDWNCYLDQIYRYIFLIESCFPEIPVWKTAIINIRKSQLRWRNGESCQSFLQRLIQEYDVDDDEYVEAHAFPTDTLDRQIIDDYIYNLSRDADKAQLIDINNIWLINWQNTTNKYGRSAYYDIFYHTPDCYVMYNISDTIYDAKTNIMLHTRSCKPLDMLVIDRDNVLNKYDMFKAQAVAYYSIKQDINKQEFFEHLRKAYVTDDDLLEKYWNTFEYELSHE